MSNHKKQLLLEVMGKPTHKQPFFWAGFIVIGQGGRWIAVMSGMSVVVRTMT